MANSESQMISNQTLIAKSRYNPNIYVSGLRKTMAHFGQDSPYLCRNLNQSPAEYDIPTSHQGRPIGLYRSSHSFPDNRLTDGGKAVGSLFPGLMLAEPEAGVTSSEENVQLLHGVGL
jgi:hypothetical protein